MVIQTGVVKIKVNIDDAKLMHLIHTNPKIAEEMLRKGCNVGRDNTQKGILTGRGEWQPLSPVTISIKGHEQILWDTGAMFKSIFADAKGNKGMYGTSTPYAPIHELGLMTPKVPKRAFLLPTTKGRERELMKKKMVAYIRARFIREL